MYKCTCTPVCIYTCTRPEVYTNLMEATVHGGFVLFSVQPHLYSLFGLYAVCVCVHIH